MAIIPMHEYIIEKRVETLFTCYEHGIKYDGYGFERPYQGRRDSYLIVKKTVASANYVDAVIKFLTKLSDILTALSVVTQCDVSSLLVGSCLVRKVGGDQNVGYFYYAKRTPGARLDMDSSIGDVDILLKADIDTALSFLRESNHATSPKACLAMMISAAESLAGTEEKQKKCPSCGCSQPKYNSTNHKQLKRILGQELHDRLYARGEIRHSLVHGRNGVSESEIASIVPEVYRQIVQNYLPSRYNLQSINNSASEVPRNGSDVKHWGGFIRMKGAKAMTLDVIEAQFESPVDFEFVWDGPYDY